MMVTPLSVWRFGLLASSSVRSLTGRRPEEAQVSYGSQHWCNPYHGTGIREMLPTRKRQRCNARTARNRIARIVDASNGFYLQGA